MELKISNSNINNTNFKIDKTNNPSNQEFINLLNAFVLAAESNDSLDEASIDIPTQTDMTMRCLLGSINLPKYSEAAQYSQPQGTFNSYDQDIKGSTTNTSQVIARNISSLYEGGSVAGDFDGQGLSLGYLQWNIGTGSLQPLLKEMATGANTKGDFDKIFNQKVSIKDASGNIRTKSIADDIRSMLQMNPSDQLNWAKSRNDSNNKIKEPWKTALRSLTTNEKFKAIEDKYAKRYFDKAQSIVNDSSIGVETVRGYTLAFDIAVQNGSVKASAKQLIVDALAGKSNKLTNSKDPTLTKNQRDIVVDLNNRLRGVTDTDTKKLYYTAAAVAISARDKYAKDVWARKSTIVSGSGVVHGRNYTFHSSGLSDNKLV